MDDKKIVLILIFSLVIIFSLLFIFKKIPASYFIPTGEYSRVEGITDVESNLNALAKGKDNLILEFKKNNTCYWIKPAVNKTNYLIEITEYETSANIKGCTGIPKEKKYIVVDKPINLVGNDCICGNLKHLLGMKDVGNTKQLKVSAD